MEHQWKGFKQLKITPPSNETINRKTLEIAPWSIYMSTVLSSTLVWCEGHHCSLLNMVQKVHQRWSDCGVRYEHVIVPDIYTNFNFSPYLFEANQVRLFFARILSQTLFVWIWRPERKHLQVRWPQNSVRLGHIVLLCKFTICPRFSILNNILWLTAAFKWAWMVWKTSILCSRFHHLIEWETHGTLRSSFNLQFSLNDNHL